MLHMPTFPDTLVVISWMKLQQNVTSKSLRERESSTNKIQLKKKSKQIAVQPGMPVTIGEKQLN